jgi:2-dehydropantoate 2-reductase
MDERLPSRRTAKVAHPIGKAGSAELLAHERLGNSILTEFHAMAFIIIGAGAIGGSAAAYLARAGHDVLLVDNAVDHVKAIQDRGLILEGRLEFTQKVAAVTPDGLAAALDGRAADAVILAVKSQHTEAALAPILPLLTSDGFVLSMQNGLNPKLVAARAGTRRTLAASINSMGTDYLSPGRIMYGGPGTMHIGELDGRLTPRVARLVEVFKSTFVENTHVTTNVWGYLWGKVSFGAMLFAGATADETIADQLAEPLNRSLLANIAGEVVRVADAEGIRCEAFDGFDPNVMRFGARRDWTEVGRSFANLEAVYRRSLKPKSGIWRDLAVRRRPTEVDAQLGIISEVGQPHRIHCPLINKVVAMIHEIERGKRIMQPQNLEQLRALDKLEYPLPV